MPRYPKDMEKLPTELMDRVLKLIDQDTKRIKRHAVRMRKSERTGKLIGNGHLDKDTAATLCKYASTIASLKNQKDQEREREKAKLSRLTTEELFELYKKSKQNGTK